MNTAITDIIVETYGKNLEPGEEVFSVVQKNFRKSATPNRYIILYVNKSFRMCHSYGVSEKLKGVKNKLFIYSLYRLLDGSYSLFRVTECVDDKYSIPAIIPEKERLMKENNRFSKDDDEVYDIMQNKYLETIKKERKDRIESACSKVSSR